ncbi:MAG: FHA domain-containing protein [Woeseiaceae bacterium]|nr:FHA domain-containing protein [Woeseiaceae bacterium]
MPEKNNKLVAELNRRGVIRALAAYAIVVWLAATGLVDLFPAVGFPDWSIRVFLAAAFLATPLVAFLAWRYNLTFKGVLRDPVDVAALKPDTRANAPTRKSTQRQDPDLGTVVATWRSADGELCEREFVSEFVVGRDLHADVRMKDDRVSRRHLRVYPSNNAWHIQDLDSLNGSYIDGKSIDEVTMDAEVDVSLDRNGPRIHLLLRLSDETVRTASSRR